MEVDLKHIAAVEVGTLFQFDRHRLDKAHQDDDGKTEISRDLRKNHRQQAQPAISRSGKPHYRFHAEDRDDRREDREHHARHNETVEQASARKTVAHQTVCRETRQDHHGDRHSS